MRMHGNNARRSRQIFYSTNSKGSMGEYTQRSRSSTSKSAFLIQAKRMISKSKQGVHTGGAGSGMLKEHTLQTLETKVNAAGKTAGEA